jgi:hypothetical protein
MESKRKRVHFRAWGVRPDRLCRLIPCYGYSRPDDMHATDAVCRSIERAVGLTVVVCRADGTNLDSRGKPESNVYELTLGTEVRGLNAGWNIEGSMRVSIPCGVRP